MTIEGFVWQSDWSQVSENAGEETECIPSMHKAAVDPIAAIVEAGVRAARLDGEQLNINTFEHHLVDFCKVNCRVIIHGRNWNFWFRGLYEEIAFI